MEIINFTQFLVYFTTYYPLLVPLGILAVFLVALLLDGLRVGLLGFIDDFETKGKYKCVVWRKYRRSIHGAVDGAFSVDSMYHSEPLGIEEKRGSFYVNLPETRRIVTFTEEENALHFLSHVKDVGQKKASEDAQKYTWSSSNTDLVVLSIPAYILMLMVILFAFKVLPLVVTLTAFSSYLIVLTARGLVRLKKRVMKHVKDPHAHSTSEVKHETTPKDSFINLQG